MKRRFFRIFKITMITTLIIIVTLAAAGYGFMQQDRFGKKPAGARLERIKNSPNYRDGQFQNLNPTPAFAEGYSPVKVMYKQFFKKDPRSKPSDAIPSIKTNLHQLPPDSNLLVWFGHSSYYMQIDGKRFLVDPVFSGNASPVPGVIQAFAGSNHYHADDMPHIDFLLITHDHYDHVDYETLKALRHKTDTVICALGVGAHFEHWGYDPKKIIENDWYDKMDLGSGFTLFTEPARHFSGRGFSRNNTLWVSYVLQTPALKIFVGGDSGYDTHYADIGKRHGAFDLAILENGQYNAAWRYIHHLPEEVLMAAKDLHARRVFPVHSSKFALSVHAWDEPLIKVSGHSKTYQIPLVTPIIGEIVHLNNARQQFSQWWVGLK
ncbi:MAG: MBL fold metallo-hydrolase [Bacteroidales bacterium]|nr:MBL fold metallo-hydrolase [Bacteroidales bacterium]